MVNSCPSDVKICADGSVVEMSKYWGIVNSVCPAPDIVPSTTPTSTNLTQHPLLRHQNHKVVQSLWDWLLRRIDQMQLQHYK